MFNTLRFVSIKRSARRQDGITTVEYAVAGGLIAAAVVIAFALLGTNVGGVINAIAGAI